MVAFSVEPIPGKGLGVVASRNVAQGERLLAETPLLVALASSAEGPVIPLAVLTQAVDSLPESSRAAFYALSQNACYGATKTPEGIAQTNGIPFRVGAQVFGAICGTASRFNHSCEANACFKWNGRIGPDTTWADGSGRGGQLTVHATRSIPQGAEISFNYAGFVAPRAQRRAQLAASFGFVCACAKCTLSGQPLLESDERINALGDAQALLEQVQALGSLSVLLHSEPAAVLAQLDERQRLLERESPSALLPGTTEVLLQASVESCDHSWQMCTKLLARAEANDVSARADGAGQRQLKVPLEKLRSNVEAYRVAVRQRARAGLELARVMAGEDSPLYHVFETALSRCWQHPDENVRGTGSVAVSFRQLLIESGAAGQWTTL